MALVGGEGVAFRVGDIVLKWTRDAREAAWVQGLLARLGPEGYRIADPVATLEGEWTHDGWTASAFIADLRPAAPAWEAIAEVGLRFADDAEPERDTGREALSRRTHRWAVADRVAWGAAEVDLSAEATAIVDRLGALLAETEPGEHVVHGDLSGNVFFDPSDVPVILDVSPYLRPRRWGSALVVADAVLWNGEPPSLAESFAADALDLDLLGRALIFRLVAEQMADDPRHGALLGPYQRLLDAFG